MGRVGVELGEHLAEEQEDVDDHGHGHDTAQYPQRLEPQVVAGEATDHLQRQDQEGGPSGKRGCQETRGDDRRVPEGPRPQPDKQEGGHGVDADGPDDRRKDKGDDEERFARRRPPVGAVDEVAGDVHVQQQIAVQDKHVPGQHREREVEAQEHVVEAVGTAQVHGHEQQAHDDRGDGQELAENHQIMHLAVLVDVGGNHQHHRGGGHAHQEREVGDVQAPRHLVGHARGRQALDQLLAVGMHAHQREDGQDAHPEVVAPVADEAGPQAAVEEAQVRLHQLSVSSVRG